MTIIEVAMYVITCISPHNWPTGSWLFCASIISPSILGTDQYILEITNCR